MSEKKIDKEMDFLREFLVKGQQITQPIIEGVEALWAEILRLRAPVPMILTCPSCGGRHIDEGEFATKVHHTHACQHCGLCWRPAIVNTTGVQFLPGFKNGR